MNFRLTRPCGNCPFLREGGIRLRSDRVREIVGDVIGDPGKTFSCHKTVPPAADDDDDDGDDDDSEVLRARIAVSSHCAGALVFARKQDAWPQLIRIAARLGLYDPRKLTGDDEIFDTLDEMLATAIDVSMRVARRTKGP